MRITQRGTITHAIKGNKYQVALQDIPDHVVMATVCGRMEKYRIKLTEGDDVTVELSPYDLKMGRIIRRH